jgi:predicted ferric reductase
MTPPSAQSQVADDALPSPQPAVRRVSRPRGRLMQFGVPSLLWLIFLGNIVAIVWLWIHGGNLNNPTTGDLLTSISRITGLLGAYLALVQILLLARLPWLERVAGFDRLTVWHRWNGHACLDLIVAHVFLSVWGYAMLDTGLSLSNAPAKHTSFWGEFWAILAGNRYPGMITATVGTALLVVVVLTSLVIARRHLSYELWYAVHLTAYAGIALGWFHQLPTGNEFVLNDVTSDYWISLYVASLALIAFRVAEPIWHGFRYRLRISEVVDEGPGVVSFRIAGRHLDRLHVQAGQFFIWRFLARGFWWTAHPFSLSEAPDGRSYRITVKALGDHTAKLGRIKPGTRVVAEGPFGAFTDEVRSRDKVLLVAGGIGITPVRALAQVMEADAVVLYRVVSSDDIVFFEELDDLAVDRGIRVHYVVGDHTSEAGKELLSPKHLRELVPDLGEREVYVCGPPAMIAVLDHNLRHAGVSRHHLHVENFAF